MPRTTIGLGIDIVGPDARIALVEADGEGFRLLSTETVRTVELPRFLRGLKRRPARTVCSVPLDAGAVRMLDLPPTTEENLERVVALEAETVLPLPTEELALSHHVLGMSEQSRVEVLLAASRLSTVQELLGRVNCVPWMAAGVTLSPVALLNAVSQAAGTGRETVYAILRVEEQFSELLVLERGRLLAAQPVPAGCGPRPPAEVSQNGTERSGAAGPVVGDFAEQGRISVLASPKAGWVEALSQQVRYALQALSYERGLRPGRLYVCGAGSERPGADWELSEALGIPVTCLQPQGPGEDGGVYAAAYGCALQAGGGAAVPLNLTPARLSSAREVEQRRRSAVSWGTLAAAALVSVGLVFGAVLHRKHQSVVDLERRVRDVQIEVAEPLLPANQAKSIAGMIDGTAAGRVSAARLLEIMSRHLPPGTWLKELTLDAETGCVIRGYSTTSSGGQTAQNRLIEQRLFDELLLDHLTESEIGGVPVWEFQLTGRQERANERGRRGRSRG